MGHKPEFVQAPFCEPLYETTFTNTNPLAERRHSGAKQLAHMLVKVFVKVPPGGVRKEVRKGVRKGVNETMNK